MRFGNYSLIANWRLPQYPQATYLKRLFDKYDIDCVLDVGANVGQYLSFLREQVGYEGRVIAFEPIPELAEGLSRKENVDVRAIALGAKPGNLMLHVMKDSSYSSFLMPDHSKHSFPDNEIARSIEVPVSTLAAEFPEGHRVYVKLDTQGFDLEVMKGAEGCDILALQTEASICPIYEGMPGLVETIAAFTSLGFVPSSIFPVSYSAFPKLIEVDLHLINAASVS